MCEVALAPAHAAAALGLHARQLADAGADRASCTSAVRHAPGVIAQPCAGACTAGARPGLHAVAGRAARAVSMGRPCPPARRAVRTRLVELRAALDVVAAV